MQGARNENFVKKKWTLKCSGTIGRWLKDWFCSIYYARLH
jgi:hypothetical protein